MATRFRGCDPDAVHKESLVGAGGCEGEVAFQALPWASDSRRITILEILVGEHGDECRLGRR